MIKKAWNVFRENMLLKLISIAVAIVIWYMVVDVNDPMETASFNVRVTVTNDAYIANGKTSYRIDESNKTVLVYIRANRSQLRSISDEDIQVTADLTQIVDLNRDPVMVPLTASCSGISPTNITLSKTAIPITIETVASKEFPVAVDTGGSVPGNDYEVGTMTSDPDTVIINGPESVVNNIDSVIAKIDVTGMTRDGEKGAVMELRDKQGNAISQETIEDDLTFEGGMPAIDVYVDLWKKQSDVSIEVQWSGNVKDGYHVTGTSTTPETITVVGTDDALAKLAEDGNKLTIPSELISVEGKSSDVKTDIPLADILPDGLRAAANTVETISVQIVILSDTSREIDVDVDRIKVENLRSSLSVSYMQASVPVRVTGITSVLDELTEDGVGLSIDLSGMDSEGDYTVPVTVSLPSGVSLDGNNLEISVQLRPKAETSSDS